MQGGGGLVAIGILLIILRALSPYTLPKNPLMSISTSETLSPIIMILISFGAYCIDFSRKPIADLKVHGALFED